MNDPMIAHIEAPAAVLEEFRKGATAHVAMAAVRQERINAASRQIENSSRLMDGIGQLTHRIDADFYWAMRHTFGEDCWKDPAFKRALERDGVIQKVKGISDKIISQRGIAPNAAATRASKPPTGIVQAGKYAKAA